MIHLTFFQSFNLSSLLENGNKLLVFQGFVIQIFAGFLLIHNVQVCLGFWTFRLAVALKEPTGIVMIVEDELNAAGCVWAFLEALILCSSWRWIVLMIVRTTIQQVFLPIQASTCPFKVVSWRGSTILIGNRRHLY